MQIQEKRNFVHWYDKDQWNIKHKNMDEIKSKTGLTETTN